MTDDDVDVTKLDFIDFPLAWAICREGIEHRSPKCSYVQASGGFLCDCGAMILEWKRRREALGLSSDGYDDMIPVIEE